MRRAIDTTIDPELCVGCGLCVPVCPVEAIALRGDVAIVVGEESLGCGHCAAACPTGAITVGFQDDGATDLVTVEKAGRYVKPGKSSVASLVRVMRSRRSCRHYKEAEVPREVLDDLVRIGTLAPSGTNTQLWTFTLVPDRAGMLALGRTVADFFRLLNRVTAQPAIRLGAKLLGKGELDWYYREYYEKVTERLRQYDEEGRDSLFHGAPAAILIGAEAGASTGREDALLATGNILLAAHAMGLGTCLIGFAVEAMKTDPRIKRRLGIPWKEPVYSVIALGYPDEKYKFVTGRRRVVPRVFRTPPP